MPLSPNKAAAAAWLLFCATSSHSFSFHAVGTMQRRAFDLSMSSSTNNESENKVRFVRDTKKVVEESLDAEKAGDAAIPASTVNDRLLAELRDAANKEKFGAQSSAGKKLGLVDGFGRTRKSDEEIRIAIEQARDLNGVNPLTALGGAAFALACAGALWYGTQTLGKFFAMHPVDTEVYVVIRATQVIRNVSMGLISLASGFSGVIGVGLLLLGVRVSYGVITGELDPTPIKRNKVDELEVPNVWDLMMNKKPGRRR